jgi:hypothetical protein
LSQKAALETAIAELNEQAEKLLAQRDAELSKVRTLHSTRSPFQ